MNQNFKAIDDNQVMPELNEDGELKVEEIQEDSAQVQEVQTQDNQDEDEQNVEDTILDMADKVDPNVQAGNGD